uniref:ATP synthase F0 subunit 8 n=1 Tax=Eupteryx gracilirama TaxID=2879584 RepID=A0A8K2APJ8_9HEMI|nr:ATP synthase F0 subunit 8 [Eupteryx gracilirama]
MPQMSPIWWMTLMITFICMLMICMNMNYFNFNKMFKMKKTIYKNKMNWLW